MAYNNVIPLHRGTQLAAARPPAQDSSPAPASTRQPTAAALVRATSQFPDLYLSLRQSRRPTFGERLVAFVRKWSFEFGIAIYLIAVGAGVYFALQMGRGL